MTTTQISLDGTIGAAQPHRHPWMDRAMTCAGRLRGEAEEAQRRGELDWVFKGGPAGGEVTLMDQFNKDLGRAEELASGRARGTWWRRPEEWLFGSPVEETWRLIHLADERLMRALTPEAVPVRAAAVLHDGEETLGTSHPAVIALRRCLHSPLEGEQTSVARSAESQRTPAMELMRETHDLTDDVHRRARSLRNRILFTSLVLIGLALALILVQGLTGFGLVPLQEDELGTTWALALTMFFGSLGGLLSAIPSLSSVPEKQSPFNLPTQQAILKVTIGAWSALVGLLAATNGLAAQTPADKGAPVAVTSVGTLALLSIVFGAGQEAVTRFADRKAADLLNAM
jgi:hypothetical protein